MALLGLYLLLVPAAELSLRGLFWVRDLGEEVESQERHEPRAMHPAYEGADYDPVATWREIWKATDDWLVYQPYTVWSRRDKGRLVSVDEEGHRVTHHGSQSADAPELWMFGGSTTWGMGVPDEETIPSRLAELFDTWGLDVRVRNLGKTGFVSMQEVLLLIRELQLGRRPQWVVVYDGANEAIGAAEAPELANPHYLLNRIRDLFEGRTPRGEEPLARLISGSATFRLAQSLRSRLGFTDSPAAPPGDRRDWRRVPPDGERGADYLLANYRFVSDLADEFQFTPWFFFQPRLGVGAKPLHASEEEVLAGLRSNPEQAWILTFTEQLRDGVRARLAKGNAPEGLHDISDLYGDVAEPVYIDWVHVTHRGNRRIAARIFDEVRADLCSGRNPSLAPHVQAQLEQQCARGHSR